MGSSPRLGLMQSLLTIVDSAATRTAAKWFSRAAAAAGTRTKSSSTRQRASVSPYLGVGGYNGKHRRLT
jgi:hypothetical protein